VTTPTDSQVEKITGVLKAVAHDVRLTLLRTLLEKGENSVSELGALTGIGQPGLSQQLGILRKAGLVQTRQDAKLVFYSLAPEALRETAELLCALAGVTPQEVQSGNKPAHSRARGSAATFARIL
jgi:DNA-binding transcriptional ArsR family regulator